MTFEFNQFYPLIKKSYEKSGFISTKLRSNNAKRATHRHNLMFMYGNKCSYCDCELTIETATIDHVVPHSIFGYKYDQKVPNKVLACYTCNHSKDNIPLIHFIFYGVRKATNDKTM
jgi:CRISPR/Cas system Type II protein with McrA/HNH and RuvC-like nuclease domain